MAYREKDDLWLIYNQSDGALYLFDLDNESSEHLDFTLVELIDNMEVLI